MATSFWDGPLKIQGNWPEWPPNTGVKQEENASVS